RQAREVQRKGGNGIIEARAQGLFKFVRGGFSRVGMDRALGGGGFLTGGGAKMPGPCEAAGEGLPGPNPLGLTDGVQDWPLELNDPEWCTVAGLAMYSAKLKEKYQHQRENTTWLGRILK